MTLDFIKRNGAVQIQEVSEVPPQDRRQIQNYCQEIMIILFVFLYNSGTSNNAALR